MGIEAWEMVERAVSGGVGSVRGVVCVSVKWGCWVHWR